MNNVPIGQNPAYIFDNLGFTPLQVERMVTLTQRAFRMGRMNMPKVMSRYGDANNNVVKSGARTYNLPRIGNQYPYALSGAAPTYSNGNLTATVTLSDPNYQQIGVGSTVKDTTTDTYATVSVISAGQMVLTFQNNANGATTFDTTASTGDFASGHQISYMGYNGGTRSYQAQQMGLPLPSFYEIVVGSWNTDAFIKKEDVNQITNIESPTGSMYYAMKADSYALDLFYTSMYAYYYGNGSQINGANGIFRGPSFINQIQTGGGIIEAKSPDWTLQEFEDLAKEYVRQGSVENGQVWVIAGLDYAQNLSNVLRPYVTTAGTNNVLSDKIRGLDIPRYECSGLVLNIIQDIFVENIPAMGTGRSDSAFWISTEPGLSESGAILPPIYDIYYAEPGLQRTVINGKVNEFGKSVANGSNDQPYCQISYTLDKTLAIANPLAAMYHGN